MRDGAGRADLGLRSALWWDERGIVLHASRRALLLGDPWDRQSMSTVTLRWERIRRVTPEKLWPDFVIEARERGVSPAIYSTGLARLVESDTFPRTSPDAIAAYADAFTDAVANRGFGATLDRGWVAAPDVCWEEVRCLPHRDLHRASAGPFRTAVAPSERMLCLWEEPPLVGLGALLVRSQRPTPHRIDAPTAIAFTEEHVYASAFGMGFRVPLAALRSVWEHPTGGGPPYPLRLVFGRRAELRLTQQASRALRRVIVTRIPAHHWDFDYAH